MSQVRHSWGYVTDIRQMLTLVVNDIFVTSCRVYLKIDNTQCVFIKVNVQLLINFITTKKKNDIFVILTFDNCFYYLITTVK